MSRCIQATIIPVVALQVHQELECVWAGTEGKTAESRLMAPVLCLHTNKTKVRMTAELRLMALVLCLGQNRGEDSGVTPYGADIVFAYHGFW